MKRLVLAFSFFLIVLHAMGQSGQEWIQYGQPYYKIPVAAAGLYQISHQQLQAAGFFASSADPQTFQLFHRGVEQAILVKDEGDGLFNGNDYIEFYGEGNDGTLDSSLYTDPLNQPHRYYNLFNDTTSYFLTYGAEEGKRMASLAESSDGIPEATYHWCEKLLILNEDYSAGVAYGDVRHTYFDQGEGWMGDQILHNQQVTYNIAGITETAVAGGKPSLEILLTGRGPMMHQVELYAGPRLLSTLSFSGFESYQHQQLLEWSDIGGDGTTNVTIRVTGAGGPDRVSAGYIRLLFPQELNMSGSTEKKFILSDDAGGVSLIKIQNAPENVRLFDISDRSEVKQVASVLSTSVDAVIPAGATLFATSTTLSAPLRRVSFREINPAAHNYVFITHPVLRQPASGYLDPVKAYAEYRALPEGGGFDTLIVNIGQLYDQFNYGEKSPRAIFQFMKFLASVRLPDYLLLIGKGLAVNYNYGRDPAAFTTYRDLVPAAGYPASDMVFTAGLSGNPHVPGVPTGRLSATNSGQVAAYLNKLKETEALPYDNQQRKNILHLSGGIEDHEPAWFRNIMLGFESVAEDYYLGGHVQALSKQSTDVKLVNIAGEVNKGLGLITFFGHSAPNTLDFDIGMVTDPVMGYDNAGKYPVFLMNGCDVGSFFLNASILGENWINTSGKGAVGFIAHSSLGLIPALQKYSTLFYQVAYGDSVFIHKGIGEVQEEVAKRYLENYGSAALAISQVQQMVLLGDPALRLFGAEKPDYAVEETGLHVSSFNSEAITAMTDSFRIHIPVRNYGIATTKNLRIEVTRGLNDNTQLHYSKIIAGVLYADTLELVIPNTDKDGSGSNIFSVTIDADHFIDELRESNNTASFEFFVPLNGTRNLYPYPYGIVNTKAVDLSFQSTDLQSGEREYVIEIDTADTFDSGFKKTFYVSATVLAKQPVELLSADTTVYYWRTKIAMPLWNESKDWAVNSFTYIVNGRAGWAQLRFAQMKRNATEGLVKDAPLRRLKFEETVSDIAIKTFSAASGKPRDSVSFRINGAEFNLLNEGAACRDNTINLVAFDRKSTQPYAGLDFKWHELLYQYGGRTLLCGREPYVINSFTPAELVTGNGDDLIQYIENIHAGDSVVLFSIGDAGYSLWSEEAKTKLGELGISVAQLESLGNGEPAILFGRKGAASGAADLFHAPAPAPSLKVNATIEGRFTSGLMRSVVIGPALRWEKLLMHCNEAEAEDHFSFDIVGIRADGGQDTLRTQLMTTEDLSGISAEEYPYLQIIFRTGDELNLTAVQLIKWLVLYEPVAEGLTFYRGPADQQVLHEGDTLRSDFGFVNVTGRFFPDSLTVRYTAVNHEAPGAPYSVMRIKSPAPGDTTAFTVPISTRSREGLNNVEIFVNPRIAPEQFFDNNLMVLRDQLLVLSDRLSPVIDVTFDGRYIENNEFVSPNPSILIRLWDENLFLRKADTLNTRIFLAFPCPGQECDFKPIYLSRDDIRWAPATDTSDFKIEFSPRHLSDGKYVLRVDAKDENDNPAGETPYEIIFQVARGASVFVSAPYPNPFFAQANVDVVITGEAPPSFYSFAITSLQGTLVQEFSETSDGLHVGKNTLTWNGIDRDGKMLPNGIYLYRLVLKGVPGEQIYFGKIVLLR